MPERRDVRAVTRTVTYMASPAPAVRLADPTQFGRDVNAVAIPASTTVEAVLNEAALQQHHAALVTLDGIALSGHSIADLARTLGVSAPRLRSMLHGKAAAELLDLAAWHVAVSELQASSPSPTAAQAPNLPRNPGDIASWEQTVWQGDCLPLMHAMPKGEVDLVLADLPYGTTRNKWDSVIALDELWACYRHVLKPGGCVVLTAAQPFTSALVMSNLSWFKYEWVWSKTIGSGQLNAKKQPMRTHESVLVFAPGTTPYFPQMEAGTPYTINRKSGAWTGHGFNDQKDHRSVNTGTRYPKSVLPVANPRIKGGHPTQKPVALFEYLIRTYTSPGDLVLDNVMGSGTTAAAAASTGRRWVGMELDVTFAAVANKRGRTAGTQTAT
jgi:DNA modification methylase